MMPKSTVIKQLAKNKVSADRLIRVRQASEQQHQDSSQQAVDNRDVMGLWDDIAFEAGSDNEDDSVPYRLGKIQRMRCRTSGRRRAEYVRPVSLETITKRTSSFLSYRTSSKEMACINVPYKQRK